MKYQKAEPVVKQAQCDPDPRNFAASQAPSKLPLISFIVVNYNYARFLESCVTSIMTQDYPMIECILVDNCSTDHSPEVIEQLVLEYPCLQVLRNAENLGQNAACSAGVALSTGSYIAFIDADDYLLPHYAGTHMRAHLTLTQGVGFTSGDLAQMAQGAIVRSNYQDPWIVDQVSAVVRSEEMRDIGGVSEALGTSFLEAPQFVAPLRKLVHEVIYWPWAPTSGNVYRRDAVLLLSGNPRLIDLKFAADAYYNFAINALAGSVLIEKPVGVYRIHDTNNFAKRAQMRGLYSFDKKHDDGARAAYFALEYIVAEYPMFFDYVHDVRILKQALSVLKRRALHKNDTLFDRLAAKIARWKYGRAVRSIGRRFEAPSALECQTAERNGYSVHKPCVEQSSLRSL